ncbi:maleylpyruvate isomerase N-terminal domain-containing protein [Streptomyces sp. NPDC056401]|uniref:maleylpyruvate isomerase N-terminal domain-containing protein n=1 Tax=Streptomyces sp. NPDC056401 TaxID=3345809 RepID=UPI0035D62DDB
MPPSPFGEEDGEEYERHEQPPHSGGPARIPGPRGAADDLDLARPGYAPSAEGPLDPDQADDSDEPEDRDDLVDLDALDDSEYMKYPEILTHPALPTPAAPEPEPAPVPAAPPPTHAVLKSLLGAWALAACSAEETQAVEDHLTECAPCAEEALRLRDAVGLLHPEESLDLKPLLRSRVLEDCLGKRPARIPVPVWASPYDTETARLDALLRDFGDSEWHTPVRLKWFEEERRQSRRTTVAGVIGHLLAVDGLVAAALGLDDPLGRDASVDTPAERTERFWEDSPYPTTRRVREPWREQGHTLVRTVSFAGRGVAELDVDYGPFALPLGDAFLERAFECWVHAVDIAEAVDYPYGPPSAPHLNRMIDLAARLLPAALAWRRRAGLAAPPRGLVAAGAPGRTLHLEIEGAGGGGWDIALDSPAAKPSPDHTVARIALDGAEFCQLAAGHISPEDAAVGQNGDREAIRDVLFAAASLSRM